MTQLLLSGRLAVIAGATSDVGRAIAVSLATAGARLCLLARDPSALDELAAAARALTDRVVVHRMDLLCEDSIREVIARLHEDATGVDMLILSAGTFEMDVHERADVADFDRQYRTNVRGPYRLIQGLIPLLRAARGQVVFVNSTVGLESRAGVGQYAATQHALRAVADALRAEVNPDGVRVLSVYLGRTATARQARIFRREGRPYAPELLIQPNDVAEIVIAALGLPRTAEVTSIRMRPLVKSY